MGFIGIAWLAYVWLSGAPSPFRGGPSSTAAAGAMPTAESGQPTQPADAPRTGGDLSALDLAKMAALVADTALPWTEVHRRYLATLSITDQWRLLNAEGVRDRFDARVQRAAMLNACAVAIRLAQGQDLGQMHNAYVGSHCAGIASSGPANEIFEADRRTHSDREDVLYDDLTQQSHAHLAASESGLAKVVDELRSADAPGKVQELARMLAMDRPELVFPDQLGYSNLTEGQRAAAAVATSMLMACRTASDCGANSMFTLAFCSRAENSSCLPHFSLDDALRQNYSPVMVQQIYSGLSQLERMRAHGGP